MMIDFLDEIGWYVDVVLVWSPFEDAFGFVFDDFGAIYNFFDFWILIKEGL